MEQKFYDSEGNERSIAWMVENEPEWAANIIRHFRQGLKMAYLATDQKTGRSYAICSADPDAIADSALELRKWKKDGAKIELLPMEEAKKRFCESLDSRPRQSELFHHSV